MTSRRLRGNLPLSPAIGHRSTASSSVSSGKQGQFAIPHLRQHTSMTKSLTPQSSDDDAERAEQVERGTRQTRLQKREASSFDGANDQPLEDDNDEDDADGEVTRCVCGQLDYPGPPVPLSDGSRKVASLAAAEGLPEDAGGLFIQCDKCHVWQHGGCVGIMQEELSPDNYYCEQCRKDLHRVTTGARGQRYSRYLPITEQIPAKTPRRPSAKDTESRSSREADSKAGPNLSSAKRRSTMNSRRDMEEEEMLKRAIEQSKSEEGTSVTGNGARRSKRGREEDTDESRDGAKRRKTASDSISSNAADLVEPDEGLLEGDGHEDRSRSNTHAKKSRNAASQAQRERDLREREKEKETERVEAAGRRRGRADRRRVDESEAPDESPKLITNARSAAVPKNTRPHTSSKPSSTTVPTVSTSHKKKAATKKGRVGRNQYSKDREQAQEKKSSPRPTTSRGSDDAGNANETASASMLSNGSKPSKPRHMNPNRTSMNDLRKRAAGILEYISRTQVEMAGQQTPSSKDKDSSGSSTPSLRCKLGGVNGSSKLSSVVNDTADEEKKRKGLGGGVDEGTFKDLSSLEMMDVLTRELVFWQKDFGKYGEKT